MLYGITTLIPVTAVDLALPQGGNAHRKAQWRPNVNYRSAKLLPEHTAEIEGVRVVNVIRALFDIHRYYGHVAGATSLDAARFNWPVLTRAELHRRAGILDHQRGIKAFRKAIDTSQAGMASPLETRARLTLEGAQLPEIETIEYQAEFVVNSWNDPPSKYFVDVLINGFIICEFDGYVKYQGHFGTSTQDTITRERLREHTLLSAGFPMIRAHWSDLNPANPHNSAFIKALRRALASYSRPTISPKRSIMV